jgi:hypothetical protein
LSRAEREQNVRPRFRPRRENALPFDGGQEALVATDQQGVQSARISSASSVLFDDFLDIVNPL